MRKKYPQLIFFITVLMEVEFSPNAAFCQAPFYQGKTLKIINNHPGYRRDAHQIRRSLSAQIYPGKSDIVLEFIEGGGGRRAANHVFRSVNPDGLTIGALSSSVIGLNVMRETGVMYDIDKFIYLGYSREREPQRHLHPAGARS